MRLLGVRVLTAALVLSLLAVIAGTTVAVLTADATWIVIALELVILVGVLLVLRSTRNAVRTLTAAAGSAPAPVPSPVVYEPGEPLDLLRRDLQRDVSALLGLYALVDAPGGLPAPGGWAATPETLLALVSEIRNAPRVGTVVECGSGTSTVWIALALRQRGGGRLVSLEHDERFAAQTRRRVAELGLEDLVEVRTGALVEQSVAGRTVTWFDDDILGGIDDVSLLFVDGPPGHLGAGIRFPAFPKLRSRLAPGAVVMLDDVDRPDERGVLEAWLELDPTDSGLELRAMTDRAAVLAYGPR